VNARPRLAARRQAAQPVEPGGLAESGGGSVPGHHRSDRKPGSLNQTSVARASGTSRGRSRPGVWAPWTPSAARRGLARPVARAVLTQKAGASRRTSRPAIREPDHSGGPSATPAPWPWA